MKEKISFVDKLSDILVKMKIVSSAEAKAMKKDFENRSKESFDNFLLSEDLVSKEDLLLALSECYQLPGFDVIGYFFDHDLLLNFPKEFLLENGIIPVELDGEMLLLVASDPTLPGLREKIAEYSSYEAEFNIGLKQDILDSIQEYYDESDTYIRDLTDEDETDDAALEKAILYPDELIDQAHLIIDEEDDHDDQVEDVIDKLIDDKDLW
ncbi:MAG: hypothetical protein P4L22_05980 [Candidatus Babeliales bacterium]|nr:hypothetical protein [Candidatus Babeliales bacterium]